MTRRTSSSRSTSVSSGSPRRRSRLERLRLPALDPSHRPCDHTPCLQSTRGRAMRRAIWLLLCVASLGSNSSKQYDDRTTGDPLEGTWNWIEVSVGGRKLNSPQHVMTCYDGRLTYYLPGSTIREIYRTNLSQKPPHLDLIPSNGPLQRKTLKCIYQIDGDTLRIANIATLDDDGRPTEFSGADVAVVTYKRVK